MQGKKNTLAVVPRNHDVPYIIAMPCSSPQHHLVSVSLAKGGNVMTDRLAEEHTIVCLDQVPLVRVP